MLSSPLFWGIGNFTEGGPNSTGNTVPSVPRNKQATLGLLLSAVLCWLTSLDSAGLSMVVSCSRRANWPKSTVKSYCISASSWSEGKQFMKGHLKILLLYLRLFHTFLKSRRFFSLDSVSSESGSDWPAWHNFRISCQAAVKFKMVEQINCLLIPSGISCVSVRRLIKGSHHPLRWNYTKCPNWNTGINTLRCRKYKTQCLYRLAEKNVNSSSYISFP